MNIFPTQYSVLKASAVGDHIAVQYNLKVISCKLLIHNVSDTYVVETENSKYIFKIYRSSHRSEEEIKGEAQLLNLLKESDVSVSHTIPDSKGNMLTPFTAAEGERFGMLFTYAEGEPEYNLTDSQLETLGTEMAKFHNVSATIQLDYSRAEFNIDTTLRHPLAVVKPAFKNMPEEYIVLTELANKAITELEKLPLDKLPTGYCQFDFLPKNFHFFGDKLTFFDFDFAGKGYLIYDITTFYIHYFFDVSLGKRTREDADRCFSIFLNAYKTIRPVSDLEINNMKWFGFGFWMFYFGFQHENFDDWSNTFYTDRFVKERVNILRKWIEYKPFTALTD
ncbi:phosphotransferase [Flavobacterium sp. AG291]|uniref:phosphotransferase n=1 Tax=Flavobacterium sp. AG291 TaxID=2184000 RepID=UPI000E0BBED7|nr:phosphotransferase [Flavobacterium sp. AG291]RDI13263.1 Ser/Thr protein kinase RdoA (MazF antagonist) [Flavobacterium sp. AG291]